MRRFVEASFSYPNGTKLRNESAVAFVIVYKATLKIIDFADLNHQLMGRNPRILKWKPKICTWGPGGKKK